MKLDCDLMALLYKELKATGFTCALTLILAAIMAIRLNNMINTFFIADNP
jgi:hypothetical protein